MDLVLVWAALVAFAMILYILLDGISLGVGLLFPTGADEPERNVLMESIAPVWDANQTWLVFGGGAIFASFPTVYGVLSSALYLPLMTFIAGLIFRGVTFEFRAHSTRKKHWNRAFFLGSLVAVLSQGVTLGGVLTGVKVSGGHFAGGPFDWLNPFSLMVGVALIPGYIMLGAGYLILKTAGPVQERARRQAFWAGLAVLGFMAVVTVWTPFHYPLVWTNWFSAPRIYFVWMFPLLGLGSAFLLRNGLKARREAAPLLAGIGLFLSGYFGLAASMYPYAIPPTVTLYEAAAQEETLRFTLWGAVIVLPLVIAYIIYSYSVFRGKVGQEGYYGSGG
jgi:cytochrome bd ubiquinol oxidase subunit II